MNTRADTHGWLAEYLYQWDPEGVADYDYVADHALRYVREQLASGSPAVIEALGLEKLGLWNLTTPAEHSKWVEAFALPSPRLVGENTLESE